MRVYRVEHLQNFSNRNERKRLQSSNPKSFCVWNTFPLFLDTQFACFYDLDLSTNRFRHANGMSFINLNLTPSSPKEAVLRDLSFEIFEVMKDDNAEISPSFRALLQQSPRYRRDLLTFLRLKAIVDR